MVLQIHCSGNAYEIGYSHGQQANVQIDGCVAFYTAMFQRTAKLSWAAVQTTAQDFVPTIQAKWPEFLEEMQGIADGSGRPLADIVAINNWDWMEEQKENLVLVHIAQPGRPSIKYLAEAGLIGKIGLNSKGVGVCLNAIRAHGVDRNRLPVHLALRLLLNAESMSAARQALEKDGVAASCHILLGDGTGAVGLECSHLDILALTLSDRKRIYHANHFLLDHPGVVDTNWLPDSITRTKRIEELADGVTSEVNMATLQDLFRDETKELGCICRSRTGPDTASTLFNIVMDLTNATAEVLMGRPSAPDEKITLAFGASH
ncbi:hypothetical protein SEPCBS119000_003546 [Sporothrix epigloea]|uniref:Peptidase C45 hydrolase domain-containing protein n=1 Tax=Sporothrix epigloea TaxID=1892477 RepID=A0ABP0DQW6_9PEZI